MSSSRKPVRIGVIGCGEMAQITHLPLLRDLDVFELAAVCDVSSLVVDAVADRHAVPRRYTDHRDLVAAGDLDAVAVLTMEHVEPALAAAEAGLHLLVEKPLAYAPADARRIVEAAGNAGVTLMVGYMRRFDPAYEHLCERARGMGKVRLIRAHDFAGDFTLHQSLHPHVVRRADLSEAQRNEARAAIAEPLRVAAGEDAELYGDMLMLCSHDLSALRGLLGQPDEVLFSCRTDGWGLLAVLDYGARGRCVLEADCLASLPGWDQRLTVHGDSADVTVRFGHPYLERMPSTVRIRERDGEAMCERTTPVSYADPFRRQWLHFAYCVRDGVRPRTGGADAAADVELIRELVRLAAVPDVAAV